MVCPDFFETDVTKDTKRSSTPLGILFYGKDVMYVIKSQAIILRCFKSINEVKFIYSEKTTKFAKFIQ